MRSDELIAVIRAFFGNTGRTRQQTREALQDAQEEIQALLDTLPQEED